MRKFTKILAVFMIACLLCGIVAMSISAADDSAINLKANHLDIYNDAETIKTLVYENFNSGRKTDRHETFSADTNVGGTVRIINPGKNNVNMFNDSVITDANGNKFYVLKSSNTRSDDSKYPNIVLAFAQARVSTEGPEKYPDTVFYNETETRYSVFDFDLSAYEYRFKFETSTEGVYDYRSATEIIKDADGEYAIFSSDITDAGGNSLTETQSDGKLRYYLKKASDDSYVPAHIEYTPAYINGLSFAPAEHIMNKTDDDKIAAPTGDTVKTYGTAHGLRIAQDKSGKWYAYTSKNNFSNFYLPEEAGVWTHFTCVRAVTPKNNEDGTYTFQCDYYYFGDGQFIGYGNPITITCDTTSFTGISFDSLSKSGISLDATYDDVVATYAKGGYYNAIAFDNFSYTAYTSGYDSTENGLGKYISDGKYTEAPLYNCDDVVYNKDTFQSANYFYIENTEGKTQYKNLPNLLENIKSEDKVYSPVAIKDYMPPTEEVKSINNVRFIAPSVNLNENAPQGYTLTPVGEAENEWVLTYDASSLTLKFKDENGDYLNDGNTMTWVLGDDFNPINYPGITTTRENTEEGFLEIFAWTYQDPFGDTQRFDKLTEDRYADLVSYYAGNICELQLGWVPDDSYTEVTFKYPGGEEVFKTVWLAIGSDASDVLTDEMKADEKFAIGLDNGWYDEFYCGWKKADGTSTVDVGAEFVVDESKTDIKAAVKGIKYNFSLYGNFRPNVYAPVVYNLSGEEYEPTDMTSENEKIPPNVTYLGFSDAEGAPRAEKVYSKVSRTSDKYYDTYVPAEALSATSLDAFTTYIAFEVEGEKLVQEITINLARYATSIFDDYICGSDEAVLALSILNYINESAKYANSGAAITEAVALIEKHSDCDCKDKLNTYDAQYEADKGNLEPTKYATLTSKNALLQFRPDLSVPGIALYVPLNKTYLPGIDGSQPEYNSGFVNGVIFKYNDIFYIDPNTEEVTTKVENITVYCATKSGSSYKLIDLSDSSKSTYVEDGYLIFRFDNIPAYAATEQFTINLRRCIKDGAYSVAGVGSANTYSLAEYIESLENSADAKAKAAIPAAKAFYAYSLAAKDYKDLSK